MEEISFIVFIYLVVVTMSKVQHANNSSNNNNAEVLVVVHVEEQQLVQEKDCKWTECSCCQCQWELVLEVVVVVADVNNNSSRYDHAHSGICLVGKLCRPGVNSLTTPQHNKHTHTQMGILFSYPKS